MGDMLSQSEIDALLGGGSSGGGDDVKEEDSLNVVKTVTEIEGLLDSTQKDILGEIGNISMGTSATTLFSLLNQKVWITTPQVRVVNWRDLAEGYDRPCVGIRVDYKEGIRGANILVLKKLDVKIIANLMMGGDGAVSPDEELTELDLSAIAEAMNQMVGSSSTSLSSMLGMKIDINTPQAFELTFREDDAFQKLGLLDENVVCVVFKMEVGSLIDSEIMQIYPVDFAKQMVGQLQDSFGGGASSEPEPPKVETPPQPAPAPPPQMDYQQPMQQPQMQYQQPMMPQMDYQQPMQYQQPMMQYQQPMMPQMDYQQQMQMQYQQPMMMPQMQYQQPVQQTNVNVQPAQFQSFDVNSVMQQKENIGIIMDVPLEVTVELGRTSKRIKEILEFSPGTVIELDKIAGEPIDIFVNGKFIARGEVVVIDENFGIRITDIVDTEDRI